MVRNKTVKKQKQEDAQDLNATAAFGRTGVDEDDDPFDELFKDEIQFDGFDSDEDVSKKHGGLLKAATFVGTPQYSSPEMLEDSISGHFTDLWSLGVIIYQMLDGKTPWTKTMEYDIFS